MQRCALTGLLPARAAPQAGGGGVAARSAKGAASSMAESGRPQQRRAAHDDKGARPGAGLDLIDLTAADDDAAVSQVDGQRQVQGAERPAQGSAVTGCGTAACAHGSKRKRELAAGSSHALGGAGPGSAAPDQAAGAGEQERSKRLRAAQLAVRAASAGGSGTNSAWLPTSQVGSPV